MFGQPRSPVNTEIVELKGDQRLHDRPRNSLARYSWVCLTCVDCQGGQYSSWHGAAGAATIHQKVHHSH